MTTDTTHKEWCGDPSLSRPADRCTCDYTPEQQAIDIKRPQTMIPYSANPYLDLLKRTLTGMIYEDPPISTSWRPLNNYDQQARSGGRDWPLRAHTMIGLKRLDNLQECIEHVIVDDIPGDFIETGVWRGGACIFMRGALYSLGIIDRIVWCADSFQGFPAPVREDDIALATQPEQGHLAVPLDEVMHNFNLYGLMDNRVQFIPGWFNQTLPGPVDRLAILRLDGDLYDSTMDALLPLYPLLSPGGYCIVDDWNVPMCKQAVVDYRDEQEISEPVIDIDGHSVYWRKDG
jgi:O-methyltransferase